MMHILMEESYLNNSRNKALLEGIHVVAKKKRLAVTMYKQIEELPRDISVVILVCASLKYASDTIEELNKRNIHPLLFGFPYMDTVYQYSELTFTYTKTAYQLTKYLLERNKKSNVAFVGFNRDSFPDRLKLMGVQRATHELQSECRVFKNKGNVSACLDEFEKNCADIDLIVCSNDAIAIMIHALRPHLEVGRKICSCTGLYMSDYIENPYPRAKVNYYKAGEQLAELYLFLVCHQELYSINITLELDIVLDNNTLYKAQGERSRLYNEDSVSFYSDESVCEVERIEQMLLNCDENDFKILRALQKGDSYEQLADDMFFSVNTVKYRIYAMMKNAGVENRKQFIELMAKYKLKI